MQGVGDVARGNRVCLLTNISVLMSVLKRLKSLWTGSISVCPECGIF